MCLDRCRHWGVLDSSSGMRHQCVMPEALCFVMLLSLCLASQHEGVAHKRRGRWLCMIEDIAWWNAGKQLLLARFDWQMATILKASQMVICSPPVQFQLSGRIGGHVMCAQS